LFAFAAGLKLPSTKATDSDIAQICKPSNLLSKCL